MYCLISMMEIVFFLLASPLPRKPPLPYYIHSYVRVYYFNLMFTNRVFIYVVYVINGINNRTLKIGNKSYSLQPLIGCHFGSLFQVQSSDNGPFLSPVLQGSCRPYFSVPSFIGIFAFLWIL